MGKAYLQQNSKVGVKKVFQFCIQIDGFIMVNNSICYAKDDVNTYCNKN